MKRKMILILTGEHNYCMKLLNHKYNKERQVELIRLMN